MTLELMKVWGVGPNDMGGGVGGKMDGSFDGSGGGRKGDNFPHV